MKTTEELQAAVDELRTVCNKHGVVLIGICPEEGILSSILIAENNLEAIKWLEPGEPLDNVVDAEHPGAGSLGSIGDLKA
jgi:hypothetical protein